MKERAWNSASLSPFGLEVTASAVTTEAEEIGASILKDWIAKERYVLLRGFTPFSTESMMRFAKSLGEPLEWEFGAINELVAKADVVVENFQPGTLEEWNIGYEVLARINPNLILTRGLGRERELAIRTSLGAGPLRLFRQLLTESVLLAALGGAAGALLATWLVRLVRALGPELPRLDQASVDGRALGFALAAALASALVFGVVPALRAARRRPQAGLAEGGRASATVGSLRTRKALAAFELMAAVVLLAGAGLLVRSFWKLRQVDPGFDPRGVLLARVSLSGPGYVFPESWPVHDWPAESAFTEALAARLAAAPGVQAVAFAHQGHRGGKYRGDLQRNAHDAGHEKVRTLHRRVVEELRPDFDRHLTPARLTRSGRCW
jgi:hypothetical protein